MFESFLEQWARTIAGKARVIAVACGIATILAAVIITRLPISADILDVMPENHPGIVAFTDFLRDFGVLNGLIIVVESPEPAPESLVTAVQMIGEQLKSSKYISAVDYRLFGEESRFIAEHFPIYLTPEDITQLAERLSPAGIQGQMHRNKETLLSPFGSPVESELIGRDPLNIRGLMRDSLMRRFPAKGMDLSTGYYLDAKHRLAFLTVRPNGSTRDLAFVRGLRREVGRVTSGALAAAGGDLRVGFAGSYARAAEAVAVIWRDMVVSFLVSLVLVLLILYVALRPTLVVLAIFLVTLSASLIWTLLLAYVLYGSLNVVTSIVSAMLIGLFVDYMINYYRRFEQLHRLEANATRATIGTFKGTGKAVISGALTTALSFFSVIVTSFRGLHELGVVAGFGILFCLSTTLVLMAACLVWLADSHPGWLLSRRPGALAMRGTSGLVHRKAKAIIAAFAVLIIASIFGSSRVRFDASLDSMGLRESAVQAVEDRIAQTFGRRGEPLFVVVRPAEKDHLLDDLDALEQQGTNWLSTGTVGSFSSLGQLLPPPSAQRVALAHLADAGLGELSERELNERLRLAVDREGLVKGAIPDGYTAGIIRALAHKDVIRPEELAQSRHPKVGYYYNPSLNAIAAHVTSPGVRWTQAGVAGLEADVRRVGPDFRLAGAAIFLDQIKQTILWDAGLAVVLSVIGNLIVLWLHFRCWRRVWLVMLPVVTGTTLTVGAMGIMHLPFNFFNVAGIALIFGFGVDYGIYLMQAHLEQPAGETDALRSVGGIIILCATTTIASCGSLITSHYRGLASIGAVLCLGAVFCLAATLLFLPSLLALPAWTEGVSR